MYFKDPIVGLFDIPGLFGGTIHNVGLYCPGPSTKYRIFSYYSPATNNELYVYKWECPGLEDPPIYDYESSPEVLNDNAHTVVYWDDGKAPFTATIVGEGFFADYGKTEKTKVVTTRYLHLYSGDACGNCEITITDICGRSTTGGITSTSGNWVDLFRQGGGVNGMMSAEFPQYVAYPGGCPFEAPAYGLMNSYMSELEATRNGKKIFQRFDMYSCYGQGYLSRQTYAELLGACNWDDCVTYQGYREGSCFTAEGIGMECMGVQVSNPSDDIALWLDHKLGRHSCWRPPIDGATWYAGWQETVAVTYTRISEWRC